MITKSKSIVLLLYITTLVDETLTEAELKNLKERILTYPNFEHISQQRLDELRNIL